MRPPLAPIALNEDAQAHLDRARHNYRVYQRLKAPEGEPALDWALVALFYGALHLVQAYACQHGPWRPGDHADRRDYLRQELRPIFDDYRDLQDRTDQVRYDLWMPAPAELESWHDRQFGHIAGFLAGGRRGIRLHENRGDAGSV